MIYRLIHADVMDGLAMLPDRRVQIGVTSPPYFGLRDYGVPGQIGLESSPDEYVARLVSVFREFRRVLKDDGTLWLNLGDSYAGGGTIGRKDTTPAALARRSKQYGAGAGHGSMVGSHGTRQPVAGLKSKDLIGIPWMVAFALRADGWYLRADIVWSKLNPMPESVTDRPTKAHEYLFLLSKSATYFYDHEAIKEPAIFGAPNSTEKITSSPGQNLARMRKTDKQRGHSRRHAGFNDRWDTMTRDEQCSGMRNKRSVWTVATKPYPDAHFATYPPDLIEPCILAGSRIGDTVLDPFSGSGTTGEVALSHQRDYIGIELSADYLAMSERRLSKVAPLFTRQAARNLDSVDSPDETAQGELVMATEELS